MNTDGQEWFTRAKLGMFYHCGLYTLLGGNENAVRSTMSKAEYRKLTDSFTLEHFNADAWVDCALSMGADYVMPTSRHAEGFCLWDSKLTDYTSLNSPCKRDIIAELSEACARKNVRFCLYFNFETWMNEGDDIWNTRGLSYAEYMTGQLTELLTNYGPVGVVWFDHGHPELTPEVMVGIVNHIKRLQPDCLVNNRSIDRKSSVKYGYDYVSAERVIPVRHSDNHDIAIEVCDSMGVKSWGYHKEEAFWSVGELARRVSRCAANGYVYLLNVEPTPDGTIHEACVERARLLGDWVRQNRQELNADRSSFQPVDPNLENEPTIGVATVAGTKLHLHLHEWPVADEVLVRADGQPTAATLSGALGTELSVAADKRGLLVRGLPPGPPSGTSPWMLTVECATSPTLRAEATAGRTYTPAPGEPIFLSPRDAQLDGPPDLGGISQHLNFFPDGSVSVGLLHKAGETLTWRATVAEDAEYDVFGSFGTSPDQAAGEFVLSSGSSTLTGGTWPTAGYASPVSKRLGRLRLAAGENRIVFKVTRANFSDVYGLSLARV
ncbi:MAG TPA: alpha-L-fucosidase [Capsulimonadaceae bacterium]|jgi:alpha-L-fucosidase